MKSNSNLLLAVVVIIAFIAAWQHFVLSRYGIGVPQQPPATESEAPGRSVSPGERSEHMQRSPSSPAVPVRSFDPSAQPKTVALEAEGEMVQFDTRGARVTSWKVSERGSWVELVYDKKGPHAYPLETFPDLVFEAQVPNKQKAVFEAAHPHGFHVKKTVSLGSSGLLNRVDLEFSNPTSFPVVVDTRFGWGAGLAKYIKNKTTQEKQNDAVFPEMAAIAFAHELKSWKSGFIFGRTVNESKDGPFEWMGVANNHFIAALLPIPGQIPEVLVQADRKTGPSIAVPLSFQLSPGESQAYVFDLYVGPKKRADLREIGRSLEQSVDFGFFGVLSKGLLAVLEYFHKSTGNYGWAIVILTLCIQIVVFPLTKKSLQHSVKMKELQPHLKKLQAQLKSDPKRLQIETLNLYKKHGMRFMGLEGCFPILLQLPIFFAFYSALNGAYELRGAPWIFWVKDLAAPDPFYILPILMGAGMFLQQKLTTVPTDPAQAKMMLFMPFIFVFLFLGMPSGLVLYWTINSLCTIAMQRILVFRAHPTGPSSA